MKQTKERINEQLCEVKELRLVGDNVENKIYSYEEAITLANELNLDLVEVSTTVTPPVCKLVDYQKFLYQKKKKEKETKNKTQVSELKEIRLSPTIGEHDLNVKVNQTKKFLNDKNRVKITVLFSGREITHFNLGSTVLNNFLVGVSKYDFEAAPKLEGKRLITIIKPKK